jgi:hypothetical protein
MKSVHKAVNSSAAVACVLALSFSTAFGAGIPKQLKSRFVVGDPVWRELPIRDDFQTQYDKCWQTAVNSILENNFDVATMDKESGYLRTTWNEGVVAMNGNWAYKVQVSLKMVYVPGDSRANPPTPSVVQKVRIQVAGEIVDVNPRRGRLDAAYRGYDQVLLQNLFQDLQGKLGAR